MSLESAKAWDEAHPGRFKTDAYKEIQRRSAIKYAAELKLEVLSHYSGGTPECALCGFSDQRALEIDHINGGGQEHRRQTGIHGGNSFYRWLKQRGYPEGYRVLCRNCNWIAKYPGVEG
jgi:hypothetical protein